MPRTFGESKRERPRSTLTTTSANAGGELQQPTGVPVRVPEREPDAERLCQRGREDHVERDHVREHRIRPWPPQLASARATRTGAATAHDPASRCGRERPQRQFRADRPDRLAKDDDPFATCGERPDLSSVCASTGCSASSVCVTKTMRTSAIVRRGAIDTRRVWRRSRMELLPVRVRFTRLAPRACGELTARQDAQISASTSASSSARGIRIPCPPSWTRSRTPPAPWRRLRVHARTPRSRPVRVPQATTAGRAPSHGRARRHSPAAELRHVLDVLREVWRRAGR